MKFLSTIKQVSHGSARVSEYIGWALIFVWVVVMTLGTIMRYVFRSPFLFQVELVSAMLVVFCCLCFASVFLQGAHIRVDLLTRRLPKRVRSWFWLFAEFMLITFAVLIIVNTLDLLSHSLEINARFPIFKVPIAPFQIFIPIGFGLLIFVVLVDFCERLYNLLKGRES